MDNERSILLSSSGSLISGEIDLSRVSKGRTVIGLTISFFFKFGSVSLVLRLLTSCFNTLCYRRVMRLPAVIQSIN